MCMWSYVTMCVLALRRAVWDKLVYMRIGKQEEDAGVGEGRIHVCLVLVIKDNR